MRNKINWLICVFVFLSACKEKEEDKPEPVNINTVPAFYLPAPSEAYGKNTPVLTLIADQTDQIVMPWDLDFHPTRLNELWILNKGTERSGGNTRTTTRR
jgi:hypothetical protein